MAKNGSNLTDKQRRFVEEYLIDLNATQAAIRAGYSEKTAEVQGSRLLSNAKVQSHLAGLQQKVSKRTAVTVDRVVKELALIGFSDLRHFAIDDNGYVDLAEGAPNYAMRAVQSIKRKRKEFYNEDGDESRTEIETEIRLWNKNSALDSLAKHLGMFNDDRGSEDNPLHVKMLKWADE